MNMSTTTTTTPAKNTPAKPFAYYSSSSIHSLDLNDLDATISISEAKRQQAFDTSAQIKVLIMKTRRLLEQQEQQEGATSASTSISTSTSTTTASNPEQELEELIQKTLPTQKQSTRIANLQNQFIDYTKLKSFQYFLQTGTLIPPSHLPPTISDEEYIAGAIIGLTQDLERYVIGCATNRDVHSVLMARDVTTSCLDYLMTFDFRNGMLRRRYDGVKYALKTCETVLYELSVTGLDVVEEKKDMGDDKGEDSEPKLKRLKTDDASNNDTEMDDATATTTATTTTTATKPSIIPTKELEELRKRMERRDELREKCIKRCRDAQKSAKQAIFALHRKDVKRALHLLKQCETIVTNDLNPLVEEDPTLHYGSYANVLEEYAEAKLFHVWLMGMQDGNDDSNGDVNSGSDGKPSGHLLTPIDFTTIPLEPGEYLGGLCDLTGEVGRYAVQQGTKRDSDGVQFCLETNLSILFSLETLQRFPSGSYVHKKMDQLRRSVQKLERMLYELSLVKATGRSIVVDSVNNDERKDKDVKGDD